ncbi:membrane hypothetical protein [uncultured Gammaproteobacteria bacterium]
MERTLVARVAGGLIVLGLLGAVWAKDAMAETQPVRGDYFVSADTVIIGCTAGAAAGVLAGSLPVFAALIAQTGLSVSVALLVNLTGLGCVVGAASGGVAILTAMGLDHYKIPPAAK